MMRRMITTTAMLLALTTAAIAQPAPAGPKEFTITISTEDLNLIGKAIEELPAKFANPLTQRLLQQINAQAEAYKKANQPTDANSNPVAPEKKP